MAENSSPDRRAWLGLGGNIGDPVRNMALALKALDQRDDCSLCKVSRLYKTPPWGKTDQAWFFNSCAEITTSLEPLALLQACLETEKSLKRVRMERWGPRSIDIDILAMDGLTLTGERLTLPHPRMTGRGFVLVPLNDIAPGIVIDGKTVNEWMALSDQTGIELASEDPDWWALGV